MRWTPKRKAEIINALKAGTLTPEAAQLQFDLSDEELNAWMHNYDAYGPKGLRTTKFQMYAHRRRPRNGPYREQAPIIERPSLQSEPLGEL
jgi:hypothetical protein